MITTDLYEKVLIEPVKHGADSLYIVSGYASANMAYSQLYQLSKNINISLLVGMTPINGIDKKNHEGFQNLVNEDYPQHFSCNYVVEKPVHSKVYIWCDNGMPLKAFVGSANYTTKAFFGNQKELVVEVEKCDVFLDYYHSILANSLECISEDVSNNIIIYEQNEKTENIKKIKYKQQNNIETEYETVTLTLITSRTGEVHEKAGLNWGQREGRDPNQAYIPIPSSIYKTDFFPKKTVHFTVTTDDGKDLTCTRAQEEYGKAIHTPHNNSILGLYFRNRLGLASGAIVSRKDLENYGRTDVTFYKLDEETYFMDFSV